MPPAKTLGEHIGYLSSLHQGHPRFQPEADVTVSTLRQSGYRGGQCTELFCSPEALLATLHALIRRRAWIQATGMTKLLLLAHQLCQRQGCTEFCAGQRESSRIFCKTPFPEHQATPVSTHGADTVRPFPSWQSLLSHNHQMCHEVLGSCWGWRETSMLKTRARAFPRRGRCLVGDDGSQQPASHRCQGRRLSLAQPGPDLRWQRAREDS